MSIWYDEEFMVYRINFMLCDTKFHRKLLFKFIWMHNCTLQLANRSVDRTDSVEFRWYGMHCAHWNFNNDNCINRPLYAFVFSVWWNIFLMNVNVTTHSIFCYFYYCYLAACVQQNMCPKHCVIEFRVWMGGCGCVSVTAWYSRLNSKMFFLFLIDWLNAK